MKILTKKIFREFRFNKFRSIVIILTVIITITLGIGLLNVKQSYDATIAAHHANLNNADLRIRLDEYIQDGKLSDWLTDQMIKDANIEAIEGRIFHYASVCHAGEDYKAYLIGVNLSQNEINHLEIKSGDLPISENEVLVEHHFGYFLFGGASSVKLEDTLTINYGLFSENFTISGFIIDSDYFYPVDEQTNSAAFSGELCIVYLPLQRLQNFLNVNGVNEILVKTKDRSHNATQIADHALTDVIGSEKIQKVIYWDVAPDYTFFYIDNPHDKFGFVFGILGLVAGATAIYNSLSKLVLAQRTHIGLYGALGAKKREVFSHYLGYGIILGMIGIGIGWVGAAILSHLAVNMRAEMHGFTVIQIGFDPLIWIGGSLFAITIIVLFSILAIIPILHLTPREAMVAPYSKSQLGQEPFLEKILHPMGIFRQLSTKIPLRTVFMNKKRSLSTVIAVATSMIILIAAVSIAYDIVYAINQNYTLYEKYDVNVVLQGPTSEELIKTKVNDIKGVATIEGLISTQVFISDFDGEAVRVPLHAFHENSTLREYHIIRGNKMLDMNDLDNKTILIGTSVAEDHHINVGDEITVTFDQNNSFELEIVGVTGELYDKALLWTIEGIKETSKDIQGIGILENITGFVFTYEEGINETQKKEIKSQIINNFQPYIYSETEEVLKTIEAMVEVIMGLLIFIGLLGLVALVLFTFSSMSLAMMDREMEFLALRAMGAKLRSIIKVIFLENLLYGVFGLIAGVPLCLGLLRPSYDYLIADMYVPVVVPFELWMIVSCSVVLCVFLSTSLLAWKTWHSSLADTLHNRMIS